MPPLAWGLSIGRRPDRLAEPPAKTEERKGIFRDAGPVLELLRFESLRLCAARSSFIMETVGSSPRNDICTRDMYQGRLAKKRCIPAPIQHIT